MPNVDTCVRLAEEAMTKPKNELFNYANKIENIPNNEKIKLFKNKESNEIKNILEKLWDKLRTIIFADENFIKYNNNNFKNYQQINLYHASNDNKKDSDLYVNVNGKRIDIELKFGAETSRNIGMKTFDTIFDNNFFSNTLSSNVRNNWYLLFYKDNNETKQLNRLHIAINKAIKEFNAFYQKKSWQLDKTQTVYMEDIILKKTGDGNSNNPLIKCILENENFKNFKTVKTGVGIWTVDEVKEIDKTINRCNIFTKNYTTNVQIKYVLNWKNNYNGYPAKLGFGSPSWNVWVTVEIIEL